MENPVRLAQHDERMRERSAALRRTCEAILAGAPPFVWEVGCGHGHFLAAYAAAHPERLCVGVDIRLERIERAERKRRRAGLENLHFVRAEALAFLEALPPAARIAEIFLLFPDPWPKRRHHGNRLMGSKFLGSLARRAGQGTRLYFRTDHEPYFEAAEAAVAAHPDWRLVPEAPWPLEFPTIFQQKAGRYRSLAAERA